MNRQETSKQQYRVRPTFFIHAETDEEAESRMQYIFSWLSDQLYQRSTDHLSAWLYDDIELAAGCLIAEGWPDNEDRIVR